MDEGNIIEAVRSLAKECSKPDTAGEDERRAEHYVLAVFESLGWKSKGPEVVPQKRVRQGERTTRVDFCFKKPESVKNQFYVEVKRMGEELDRKEHVTQALNYGKNSSTKWVILTNFLRWRVFNSDYFDAPEQAELLEFGIDDIIEDKETRDFLILFGRNCDLAGIDDYAKKHKKWKESADIEELLSESMLSVRKTLAKAIFEQNKLKFEIGVDAELACDECVQHILDRLIFCRMLEDNGVDAMHRLGNRLQSWEAGDKRVQFYRDVLCHFWLEMYKLYDSTIFDQESIDRLSIKNDDFIPILKSFYTHSSGLRYDFGAISLDVLGHAYENYLSYKVKKTEKRTDIVHAVYVRKQAGIYYTPEFLVDFLVKSTLGELLKKCKSSDEALSLRILDPACGSGTFLVRAYEEFRRWYIGHSAANPLANQTRLDAGGNSGISGFLDRVLEQCIYGIDRDPRAARLAKLNLFLRAANNPKRLPELNIIERDSLVWDKDFPKAFLFERDFPLVFEKGGFDVVLGNPPWEKWKPDSQEFFEERDPGFKSLGTKEAKKRMAELFKKRPYLKKEWNEYLQLYEAYSEYYRDNYSHQSADVNGREVSGDLDLYKLFTERAFMLAERSGMVGFVIPSGIYTDLGAKGLRKMLFEECEIRSLFAFENRRFIFPDVDQRYKFVLISFSKGLQTKAFKAAFFLYSKPDLDNASLSPTQISVDFVKSSSPSSWNILEVKSAKDMDIVKKILKQPQLMSSNFSGQNILFSSGFHMTNDSHLFNELRVGLPLLEGKNIHQFTHRWKEAPMPRFFVKESDVIANLKEEKRYDKGYWIAYRLIARSTDERTLISTVIPPGYVCGNSIAIIKASNVKDLCFFAGVLNSFVLDWYIRQKVSANVNMFYVKELPLPEIIPGKEYDAIVRIVCQLIAVTDEFTELKQECGVTHGVTGENDRMLLRARLDSFVAGLFGITKDEMAYILTKFPLVDNKIKEAVLQQF